MESEAEMTATSGLPISQSLLEEAETVLAEHETLPVFVEPTLREAVARRRVQREFVARGRASAMEARRTGEYVDATEVHATFQTMLNAARRRTN